MSRMPPSPFLESVAALSTDDPTAAQQPPPVGAAVGDPFSVSGADGSSTVQCGGRLIPESQPADPRHSGHVTRSRLATHTFDFQSSDGDMQPDVRCREQPSEASEKALPSEALSTILAEVLALPPIEYDEAPSFLSDPSCEYLAALERA